MRTPKIRSSFLFLSLFLSLAFAAPAFAAAWDALYVFGDSYSDSGAGYADINGPTAVVYLARRLEIPFTHANDPDHGHRSLNFANSGAQTGEGEGRRIKEALLGLGMQNQARDFASRVAAGAIRFDSARTLFFIAGGLNDRRLATEVTLANLRSVIGALHAAGARHFLVALLPTQIPSFREVGLRLNPALATLPASIKLPGASVRLSRWGEFFDDVMTNAARHGITNTTDACAGRAIFDEDTTPRGDPETYYFYHAGHPSTAVHRLVGERLLAEALAAAPPVRSP